MKVFLATPIAGFVNNEEYVNYKETLIRLIARLGEEHSVYSELSKISDISDYDSPSDSIIMDLNEIIVSDVFILHYPKKMLTSAIFELGYALAHQKKIIIITSSRENLPFLLQEIDLAFSNAHIILSRELSDESIKSICELL